MLENLKDFVRQIIEHIKNRTEPMSDAIKEKLTSVLTLARDKIQQLQGQEVAVEESVAQVAPSPFAVPQTEELLWILAGGDETAFVNYLSNFPDEDLRPLLRNPAELQSRIQQLQAQNLIGDRGEVDGIPKAPANSSTIYGFQYDEKSKKLKVRFNEGKIYEYEGVAPYIYKLFEQGAIPAKTSGQNKWGKWWVGKSNPSYGASFYELIRLGGYPYKKLN